MPPWRPVVAVVVTAGLLLNIVFYPWKDVSRVDGDMGLRLRLAELWRNATASPHTALLPYADTLGVAGTIFVANLPRRVGRLQSMTALADTIGAHFTLVDAFDKDGAAAQNIIDHVRARRAAPPAPFAWPAARPDVPLNWTGPLPPGTPVADGPLTTNRDEATPIPPDEAWQYQWLTTGSVACWETHLRIVRQIADMPGSGYWSTGRALPIAPADVAIILEDDVDMELDIRERLLGLWSALPKEWDMVFLGWCWSAEGEKPAIGTFAPAGTNKPSALRPSSAPQCTHAYAVSIPGARKLLAHLEYPPFAYSRAIDQAYAYLIETGRLIAYTIDPALVIQRKVDKSDLGTSEKWSETLYNPVFGK